MAPQRRSVKRDCWKMAEAVAKSYRAYYRAVKVNRSRLDPAQVSLMLAQVERNRVDALAQALSEYIQTNLPKALESKSSLAQYQTNPYVILASASALQLNDADSLAKFLFDTKFYMGLETSFGKSIESKVVGIYPIGTEPKDRWGNPDEKVAEAMTMARIQPERRVLERTGSIWREIDQACISADVRYLVSVKSGPRTINDTQVAAMVDAISANWRHWRDSTRRLYPHAKDIELIIGLTYGTDRTTNNKENQILLKLQNHGFKEVDRAGQPGVFVSLADEHFRVRREVGRDFWARIGRPDAPDQGAFVFLEVLLGLAKALSLGGSANQFEIAINAKLRQLGEAFLQLTSPLKDLPPWLRSEFSPSQVTWLVAAMGAFFDE